jgi:hypothetical protein
MPNRGCGVRHRALDNNMNELIPFEALRTLLGPNSSKSCTSQMRNFASTHTCEVSRKHDLIDSILGGERAMPAHAPGFDVQRANMPRWNSQDHG